MNLGLIKIPFSEINFLGKKRKRVDGLPSHTNCLVFG